MAFTRIAAFAGVFATGFAFGGLVQLIRDSGEGARIYTISCAALVTVMNVLFAWSHTWDLQALDRLFTSLYGEIRRRKELRERIRKEGQR